MLEKAILELNQNNIDMRVSNYKFIKADKTYIDGNNLFYENIPHALRLLLSKKSELKSNLKQFGTMLDLSRGAVFKISYLKELIRKQAMLGVNEIWLYLEDMYELDSYEEFGYLRGKYSFKELEEVFDYAKIFGIKIVPAIQTLGHHEQFLRWSNNSNLKDQERVLLADSKDTYKLIEEMFKFFAQFNINKIHVGLDETFGLGFGAYYKKNGFKEPLKIFSKHLDRVNKLALKHGFSEVLIWSDMYYRFLSETEYYYDPSIKLTDEIIKLIPKNITLVYWDYYNHNDMIVDAMIKSHLEIGRKFVFASGTWIWTRFNYDKKKTDLTAKMHLEKTLENKCDSFIMTQWMDDGAYSKHISSLLGIYELSNIAYEKNIIDSNMFNHITNLDYQTELNNTKLNNTKLSQVGLLWDDPLVAIYINNYFYQNILTKNEYLLEQEKLISIYDDKNSLEYLVANINYYKIISRLDLVKQYKDRKINKSIIKNYKKIIKLLKNLNNYYINMWHKYYKHNGLEIIQSRIATQIIRHEYMINVINNFKTNDIIDLLEEKPISDQYMSLKYNDIAFSTKIL